MSVQQRKNYKEPKRARSIRFDSNLELKIQAIADKQYRGNYTMALVKLVESALNANRNQSIKA